MDAIRANVNGRAQFAAILLRFPKVMERFVEAYEVEYEAIEIEIINEQPTQANILDEILRMNGKEID